MTLYLYLLKRDVKPPYSDVAFGFVVRAADGATARDLCSAQAGDEGKDVWQDPKKAKLLSIGIANHDTPAVILRDFNAG